MYCVPFVFLAMNEDAVYGTCWFYLVMIVAFGGLAYLSVKTKNILIMYIGNCLSFVSSCFLNDWAIMGYASAVCSARILDPDSTALWSDNAKYRYARETSPLLNNPTPNC